MLVSAGCLIEFLVGSHHYQSRRSLVLSLQVLLLLLSLDAAVKWQAKVVGVVVVSNICLELSSLALPFEGLDRPFQLELIACQPNFHYRVLQHSFVELSFTRGIESLSIDGLLECYRLLQQ